MHVALTIPPTILHVLARAIFPVTHVRHPPALLRTKGMRVRAGALCAICLKLLECKRVWCVRQVRETNPLKSDDSIGANNGEKRLD